jgi:hypothetical protein
MPILKFYSMLDDVARRIAASIAKLPELLRGRPRAAKQQRKTFTLGSFLKGENSASERPGAARLHSEDAPSNCPHCGCACGGRQHRNGREKSLQKRRS